MTPDGPGALTDSKFDAFFIDNLDEATWFQAALLRVIPGLANAALGSIAPDQRAETYQQIARGSAQFVRDMSLIPTQISRYIGEDAICEGQIGLWSAILTDPSPEAYLAYFKLVEYDGKLGVAFSDDFTERLFAKTLELITKINPVTGKPFITADNWYGCPGIHKLGGGQLNMDMWQHHVAIAPQIYEAVAA